TLKPYTIKGLTPASEDIFRYRVYFKEGYVPKIGDKVIFLNAGAYIYYTDLFNLERPKIEIID
ncbi:MAG: decarboxylase, partial [Candidatus ainarchaeum sp.]|nr:decarboxylase [Candidatus ainarchaeum sp.]